MVTIVTCYVKNTFRLMKAFFHSIEKHDAGSNYRIMVYTNPEGVAEVQPLCDRYKAGLCVVDCPKELYGSKQHGFYLDEAMKREEGLVLTLDSDCFPIADNWLGPLVEWHEQGYALSGIRWPWYPPEQGMDKNTIDYRIRKMQNWNNTWVACQLVEVDFVKRHGLSYYAGDDTGFTLVNKVNELGLPMEGYMPTKCAKPKWASGFDSEMNRHQCVIYADKMIHLGGGSACTMGVNLECDSLYEGTKEMIFRRSSGSFLLEHGRHHQYRFDNEEEVAEFRMRLMKEGMRRYLETHESLFNS